MKLIYRADSLEEANEIKTRLEMAGIPAMISGENFSGLRIPFYPNNLGIFIYLDNQYTDAQQVITDPDYQPESSIDIQEFYQLLDSDKFRHNLNKNYVVVFGWIFIFIVLVIMLLDYLLY